MASIKIYGDIENSSIFFINSTVDPKPLNTIVASLKSDEDRIVVQRNDRFEADGVTFRTIFKRLNPNRVQNKDGQDLVSALGYTTDQVIEYINEQANLTSGTSGGDGSGTDLTGESMGFKLDATNTSIMFDNGFEFGANTIKAIDNGDGCITIVSELGDLNHFKKLDHTLVSVNGESVSGGLNDVINTLNELFTVGAFEQVVISDPYSTMIADVDGVSDGGSLVGSNVIDPAGNDLGANTTTHNNNAGYLSANTINQAGEYFTFDIRGEGQIGFGLVHTEDSFNNGYYSGNSTYANPSSFCNGVNSSHYGYQFAHFFHPTPNGSWTNYGANTGYSMRSGWSSFPDRQNWLDGNPVKMRVGIDENGYISIDSYDPTTSTFIPHSRTSYVVPEGVEFKLGIKFSNPSARLYSEPKVHLLEEEAPTMYFRYIESPDGVFNYPLFATQEEAEYYDKIVNGVENGSSHTHTYADDPTNTTWYMPEASHDASTYQHSSAPSGSETFNGVVVTYTEVSSRTNAELVPSAYVGTNLTQEEGTNVNIQVSPQDVTYSTSVDISPSGSGLVYNGTFLIQGTLSDVGSDTTYTVTVTRANSYGSSVGTFTITSTDVAPPQTNSTPWTKALDFSGSNEHLKQVNSSASFNAIKMTGIGATALNNFDSGRTSAGTYARPWATAIVFRSDRNNSNQHIWNIGEGASNNNDNIYLRTDSLGNLYFGWGRGSNNNECTLGNVTSTGWNGIYIAHKGGRFNSSSATSSNLSDAFSIKRMGSEWATPFGNVGSELSTSGNWISTGNRMDRSIEGDFTIGGRGSNRNFHGKIASMVVTTLRKDKPIPSDTEIELMITDPKKWEDDYRVGQVVRASNTVSESTYDVTSGVYGYLGTQIWLMGDGSRDSFANGIRNDVFTSDQNYTKLQQVSMVSNDIQTVNINGLT